MRMGFCISGSGAPMPFRLRRPMLNQNRLSSMPTPEAMNTILYDGMPVVPNRWLASHSVSTGEISAPALMPM